MRRPLHLPSAAGMLDSGGAGASLAPSRRNINVVVREGVDVRLDPAFEKPSDAVEDQAVLFGVRAHPNLLKSQSRDRLRYRRRFGSAGFDRQRDEPDIALALFDAD